MDILPLAIPELKLVRPHRHGDGRGWFKETYRRDRFVEAGIAVDFVQDNQSFSAARFTVRGLHCQRPPHAQAKLVCVLAGRILDVALDLRRSAPSYGAHVAVELDASDGAALYIPVGFAHGFCTLCENTLVAYKVSDAYAPQAETGVFWADPALGIAWPAGTQAAVVSDRDRQLPRLAALEPIFS